MGKSEVDQIDTIQIDPYKLIYKREEKTCKTIKVGLF